MGVTVQIPFELITTGRLTITPRLIIFENGERKAQVDFGVTARQVYVANTGDDVQVQFPELQTGWLMPVIRHLDKTWVRWWNPARPGETLSMWAVGLGQGVGGVQARTGHAAPEGVVVEPGIDMSWGKNLKPRMVDWKRGGPRPSAGIVSARMIPGEVGVYEILFKVPDTIPRDVPPCFDDTISNMTVSIGYPQGGTPLSVQNEDTFDGGAICVAQPAATERSKMAVALIQGIYRKLGMNDPNYDPNVFPYRQSPPYFSDVPESHPQYKWIQRMADLKITSGCLPGRFCPENQVTNSEMAVFTVRAMQVVKDPCVTSQAGCGASLADSFTIASQTPYYRDVPASHQHFRWVQKARELNLIRTDHGTCDSLLLGCPEFCPLGSFCPSGTTTVAKMHLWVGRALFSFPSQ